MNISVRSLFHLYDHTIKSILTYGSEASFTFNLRKKEGELRGNFEDFECKGEPERIHKKMMRYTLGLNNKSTIDAMYAEVGRYPIYSEIVTRLLKYEQRLDQAEEDTLVKKAYRESKALHQEGKTITWMTQTNHIKRILGMNPSNIASKGMCAEADQTMKSRFRENWKKRLMSDKSKKQTGEVPGNKLRTFRKFKSIYKFEPYLEISTFTARKNLCRFRLSAHSLRIETGRHKNTQLKDRLCTKCNLQQIEDEEHALIRCPFYKTQRQLLFQVVNSTNSNFDHLPDEAKFIWLMSSEDGTSISALAKFVNNFF